MKFSEIEQNKWPQLETFLDTCLLPITGLEGNEQPWEVTNALEALQQIMDHVEIPFRGRIVTYPSLHYIPDGSRLSDYLEQISGQLRQSGFRYVILVTAKSILGDLQVPSVDLLIHPNDLPEDDKEAKQKVGKKITEMWSSH